jgi:hypothetical protein
MEFLNPRSPLNSVHVGSQKGKFLPILGKRSTTSTPNTVGTFGEISGDLDVTP